MDYLNIRSLTDSKKLFHGHSIFHPDSYIANKHKSNSTYNGVYHRSNDLIHFHHSPTEYNLYEINNGTNSISLNSPNNNNNNNNNNSQSLKPLSIKIHQQSTDKHHIHLQQTKQPTELDNNSTSDICSTSSSLSDHTTNGRNCTCQIHSYSLPYNGGIKQMMNNDIDNVCIKHRTLPLIPNKYEHNQQIQQHSSRTLTSSQLTTPMVSWRIKDSKEYYYNKKLLRLIEHLPEDKQNSIGLILLSMDVKLFNDNKSLNHQINNVNYSDIFCGGLEYRLREALQLVQPKNKIMNNDFDQRFNTTNHTTDKNNINMELNKSCLNKIIDARSRKNFNESTKTSTNFSKEYPKEDGRESGIDPDTLDETSISIMGNSLSLNDMKYTTNGCSNTNELTKPNVITVLKRLARYLALRIANKRHSLATANQHVARNAIEEKLLRSRLSELNIDKGYGDSLMNSWNSLQSIELNRGTIVNRFDRWHNNTIAVIQLLCQLARRLAILDGQLYYYNKKKFYDNVILLCKQEINSNNNTNTTNNSSNDYYLLTSLSYTHLTPSSTIKPSMISNSLFNDFNSVNNQCESSQIIEQQKQLITQIKEAQLLRNELETCRRRLLESIPANLKCDLTHTILGKLGRDFIDNDKLNKLSTSSNTINNSNNHDIQEPKLSTCANQQQQVSERQRITLEETSDIEVNEDKIDCQQINTTTSTTTTSSQFLRQRVAEHLIEFLNWFVLSQIFETEIKVDQDLWESIQDELRFELSY
ncbi:hypothetical protein EWB00_005192 [Schistosoma japonicum]|uniref:Uncharacterized protein n=1 Tax=Schistosoma japonicum TaxID=6182 RepID=A0A4Z2D2L0_SCHJA|nr:hypothetical protein EWB00_005192 [Schistosoma japonicum]